MIFRFLLLATLLLLHTELRAESAAEKAGFIPKLIIYLAKGPANSCGLGCNSWIAVEGEVDRGAAARIRRFLAAVKDTQRPIYLHSPGGVVEESFAIARLLRGRKAVARVGRTIVAACAAGTQVDGDCLKIKSGGGEVQAELATRNAMCNSACGYMILGATTREVAPDAAVAVHSSKLTVAFRGHPSPQQLADYRNRSMARAERERAAFVVAMGISRELDDLIRTVKFEKLHILTRPELFRFGIDTRPVAETSWRLETEARPFVRKIGVVKQGDGASFRTMEWRLFCEKGDRARLMFVREFDQGAAATNSLIMMAGSEKSVAFGKFPARIGKYEAWSDTIAPDAMKAMLAASTLQMGEGISTPEGKTNLATFDIDTIGLEASWTRLLASCPPNGAGGPAAAPSSPGSSPAK
jgi:hypothetical protein